MNEHDTTGALIEEYHRARLSRLREGMPLLIEQLKATGIASLTVTYDGCGDEGQIQDVALIDSQGNGIDIEATPISEAALRSLFDDLIDVRFDGWEIGDGAFGEFVWSVADGKVRHSHHARFTDYDSTEVEGI